MRYIELATVNEHLKTLDLRGKEYATVNERVKAFRMLFPNGCIETEMISLIDNVVMFKATARDENGVILGTGHAQETKGSSNVNKTSFIENCETSAVGRALGFVGFGIDGGIASFEEYENALEQQKAMQKIKKVEADALRKRCENNGINSAKLLATYKVDSFNNLTYKQYDDINERIERHNVKEFLKESN